MSKEALQHLKLKNLTWSTDSISASYFSSKTPEEYSQHLNYPFHNGLELSILTGWVAGGSPKPHLHYEVLIRKNGIDWENNPWYPQGPTSHLTEKEVIELIGKMDDHII
jgi:hypothetical protein